MGRHGSGMSGGRNVVPGYTKHGRSNARSMEEMRRQFWIRIIFANGKVKLERATVARGCFGIFMALVGPKIRVDGGVLEGRLRHRQETIRATIRRDGRTLTHSEVMAASVEFVAAVNKKKRETKERLLRLDAALEKIGTAPAG